MQAKRLIPVFSSRNYSRKPNTQGAVSLHGPIIFSEPTLHTKSCCFQHGKYYVYSSGKRREWLHRKWYGKVNYILRSKFKCFSPNGDGKNDTWIIDYIDQFRTIPLKFYNRWGEQYFTPKDTIPINAQYRGRDLPVELIICDQFKSPAILNLIQPFNHIQMMKQILHMEFICLPQLGSRNNCRILTVHVKWTCY